MGITINKAFKPTPHLKQLKEKISKFDKMITICKMQKTPIKKIKYIWATFLNSVLQYGSFMFLSELSTKKMEEEYNRLYLSTIKRTFGFAK